MKNNLFTQLQMSTFQTRIASSKDIEAVALLFDAYRQFYQQDSDLVLATRFIRDRISKEESVIILAESADHSALGFCQMYPSFCSVEARPIYTLYDLFVQPDARRNGAGKALLLAAERHAARNGVTRMDLTTARTNIAGQALYQSQGWVQDAIFFSYSKQIQV